MDLKNEENNTLYKNMNTDKKHYCGILTDGLTSKWERPKPIQFDKSEWFYWKDGQLQMRGDNFKRDKTMCYDSGDEGGK